VFIPVSVNSFAAGGAVRATSPQRSPPTLLPQAALKKQKQISRAGADSENRMTLPRPPCASFENAKGDTSRVRKFFC
jgi:hypothetical protein